MEEKISLVEVKSALCLLEEEAEDDLHDFEGILWAHRVLLQAQEVGVVPPELEPEVTECLEQADEMLSGSGWEDEIDLIKCLEKEEPHESTEAYARNALEVFDLALADDDLTANERKRIRRWRERAKVLAEKAHSMFEN